MPRQAGREQEDAGKPRRHGGPGNPRARLARFTGILTAVFLASLASGIARPSVAYYVRYTLHGSMLATAGLTSGFMAGRALSSITSGILGDISRRLRWLLAGGPVLAVAGLIYAIPNIRDPAQVLLVMGVWGLLAGLAWPSAQVVTAHLMREYSGTAMSIYFAVGTGGIAVGNKLFGSLHYDYTSMIRLTSFIILASGLILLLSAAGVETPEARGRRLAKSIASAAGNPLIAWILFSAFVIGMMAGLLREYFYVYSREVFGVTRADLGNLLLYAGIAGIIAGLAAGRASDKRGVGIAMVGVLLLSALGSFLLGASSMLALLVIGYLIASAGSRASMPLTRNATIVRGAGGGTIVGLSNAVNNVGMMIGPVIAGALYRHGFYGPRIPYIIVGLLLLADALLYLGVSSRKR